MSKTGTGVTVVCVALEPKYVEENAIGKAKVDIAASPVSPFPHWLIKILINYFFFYFSSKY